MAQSTVVALRAMTVAAALVVLASAATTVGAQGIDCSAYANAAVAQSAQNKTLGCGFTGNRWLDSFQAHFAWCSALTTTAAQTTAEANGRAAQLTECANRSKVLRLDDSICRDYAAEAVAAAKSAASNGCNFSGNRWLDDYSAHLAWCNTATVAARAAEENARDIQLRVCLTVIPPAPEVPTLRQFQDAACQAYAAKAVAAAKSAASNGCNFTGNRWLDDYSAHFEWCRGAPVGARDAEQTARETQLKVCLTVLSR